MWIHTHLSLGNGEGVSDFELALDTVLATRECLDHPIDRTPVPLDGEFGNVPWFAACREHGLPFVTRLNRPKLYEDPEVLDRLRSATWCRVPGLGQSRWPSARCGGPRHPDGARGS